ncbi:hypothetical protein C8A05DRAFT_39683 [Staphylotrichum tortipilum]|uniref:Uncharacterized protein n=1 Tax=Staphylotrichum tortipilum TaxID=2831512 RepID=A0AAN6MB74_9PEZI|nr:hypothetical protein C8A05DRAFT_39683 [Staphylotrichum longicolle]
MVSIAAAQEPLVETPTCSKGDDDDNSLSHSAIWYPDMPPPGLALNESFLVAPDVYTSSYRPLFWSRFGVHGGMYLAALVKITISGATGRMDFSFPNPTVPDECRSFGRIADDGDDDETVEFPIDGPGGEIIDRVERYQELFATDAPGWLAREGDLIWLKIHTNRGWSCEVSSKPGSDETLMAEKEFLAAPGTLTTGFYGVRVY